MQGLFDLEFHERKIKEYQPPLTKLDKVVDWNMFSCLVPKTYSKDST